MTSETETADSIASVKAKNPTETAPQTTGYNLWGNQEGRRLLIESYFRNQGKIKHVSQELEIRRNTIISIITQKMIPQLCSIWIEDCAGDLKTFAESLGCACDDSFRKTLKWHQRFERHISSLEFPPQKQLVLRKIFTVLRGTPHIPVPFQKPTLPHFVRSTSSAHTFHSKSQKPDTQESIAQKVTQISTLKFGTMLLLGETGSGKGFLAKQIYDYLHPQKKLPYFHINCAHLVAAGVELFGSVKGAFTDAVEKKGVLELLKYGGVLFLDEVDSLSMEMQLRLLLVLGEDACFRRVGGTAPIYMERFTLVTASNQNLEQLVQEKRFRQDLLGRISPPVIRLKTWQQQPLDVKMKVITKLSSQIIENDFEAQYSLILKKTFQLSSQQRNILITSDFPYNIRGVRKQLTEFMNHFLLKQAPPSKLTTFQF